MNNHRKLIGRATSITAIAVLLGVGAWTVPVAASEVRPDSQTQPTGSWDIIPDEMKFSEEEIRFQSERAEAAGKSLEDVRADDIASLQLGELALQLRTNSPNTFMESRWRPEETPQGQIILVGDVPAESWTLIKSAPIAVDVIVTDGPNRTEADATIDALIEDIQSQSYVPAVTAGYDPIERVYTLAYMGDELTADEIPQARMADGASVELTYAGSDLSGVGPQFFGGDPIGGSCTAGFVIWNGQSTYGISTAAHCPNLNGNFNYGNGLFSNGGTLNPLYGDVRWGWASAGTITKYFRDTTTSLVPVTSLADPSAGQPHCTYGKNSKTSCGTVFETGLTIVWAGYPTLKGMACDTTPHTVLGDSGGPNFGGYAALGLTSGVYPKGPNNGRATCFTPVGNLPLGAGIQIHK